MDAGLMVDQLRRGADAAMGELAHEEQLAPRPATPGTLQERLAPELTERLAERGITLYAHQAAAAGALLAGQDVVVATPAASGKSLCGQIPVAQALLTAPRATALYLFPTKALAQDQLRGLRALLPERLARSVAIFDGDTPQEERAGVRRSARVVFTNPDMLHYGILPHHKGWARLLAGLRYVIVDESHTYRGV
ncbi:MAG: DEAD/DEAH box helicase, partial [Chloroflexota bacterium]